MKYIIPFLLFVLLASKDLSAQKDSNNDQVTVRKRDNFFFAAVGVSNFSAKYTGENLITANGVDNDDNRNYMNRSTSSYLPLISIGANIPLDTRTQRWLFRPELSGSGFKSEVNSLYKFNMYAADEWKNNYKVSGIILTANPTILFNVYNHDYLKFYIGGGPALNYVIYSKNLMYQKSNQPALSPDKQNENFLVLKNFFANVSLRSGITVNNQVDLGFAWFNKSEFTNYAASSFSIKAGSLHFSIKYLF